jgi:MYXO-CTERM domain-containing protein
LFDEIRKGPRVLNYLGHAGITALGRAETLFSVDDLETMTIDGTQPIFADMTCVASRFAVPGLVSLDEAMLIDDQGAIAVWGPSGISINEQATLLARELMTKLSSGEPKRLGPLINDVLATVVDLEFGRGMIEIYHLFGDPALRIAKSDGSGGTGGSGGSAGSAGSAGNAGTGGTAGSGVDRGLTTAGCAVAASKRAPTGMLLALLGLGAFALRRRRRADSHR